MGIGFYRSWDDVSAPVLNQNNQGSFVQLLKTILVDGYGTGENHKPGFGWELYEANSETHSSITEAVFKNVSGSGHYLMCDGSGIRDNDASYKKLKTYCRACESVEGFDSGLGLSPPLSITEAFVNVGHTAVYNQTVEWKIFGNARSFWFVVRRLQPEYPYINYREASWHPYFFGDYDKYYVNNSFNFMTIQSGNISYYPALFSFNSSSYCASYILRDVDLKPGGVFVPLFSGSIDAYQNLGTYTTKGPIGNQDVPYTLNRYSIISSDHVIGQLPGIYSIQQRGFSGIGLDKKIESSDHILHYLYQSESSTIGGYYVFIEGKGYDDAV